MIKKISPWLLVMILLIPAQKVLADDDPKDSGQGMSSTFLPSTGVSDDGGHLLGWGSLAVGTALVIVRYTRSKRN